MSVDMIELLGKSINMINITKRINKTVNLLKIVSVLGMSVMIGLNIYSVVKKA